MIKISFFGAAGEVTGSNFLLEEGGRKYVIDCGLFQGGGDAFEQNEESFPYDPKEVEAVAITHAHLDHVGRLPKLVREGFRGAIYATDATAELASLVLEDALGLMEDRVRRGQRMLYEEPDLRRTMAMFKSMPYNQPHDLGANDRLTFFDAGHILGSATHLWELGGKKVVFSGDIGSWPSLLLPPPDEVNQADVVVMESTYGGQDREERPNRLKILEEALDWTVQHKGVLLIPAFAIERSQEILYLLNQLFNEKRLPRIPIFLDSPLAIDALEVFEKHQNLFSQVVQRVRRMDNEIFSFNRLVLANTTEESREINEVPPPKVIIAGSGMMEGGRIYHHLKRYLDWPQTYLLVVGHQVEGTLGREIIDGADTVKIMGENVPVRANVKAVDVFSSHADNDQLVEWLSQIKPPEGRNQHVYIVHGNPDHAAKFVQSARLLKDRDFHIAEIDKTIEIS